MDAILTLYEGDYHYGVGALINSALAAGFSGRFVVGFRDALPPWTAALMCEGECEYVIANARISFYQEDPPRHLGFHKPFAALSVFDRYPDIDTVHYADPDITFLAPWSFFSQWSKHGIGVVQDANFYEIALNHPWRHEWEQIIRIAGRNIEESADTKYPNGGYFSATRQRLPFLEIWRDVTIAFEQNSGDTRQYQMRNRWKAVVSDQDLLAASLMVWSGSVSLLGREAMGFSGYLFILAHAIESQKPWAAGYLRNALRGMVPSRAAAEYLKAANRFIRTTNRWRAFWRVLDYRTGQLVTRFYRRGI